MKTNSIRLLTSLLLAGILIISGPVSAQDITKETRELSEFTGIDAGGAFDIYLSQGNEYKAVIESEAKYIEKIFTEVDKGILSISSKGIKSADKLTVFITCGELSFLDIHGAASLRANTSLKGTSLKIKSSGASDAKLEIYYDKLVTDVSGAASLNLSGEAREHTTNVSGAASLLAYGLSTEITKANASGAANANINASSEVISNTKGAGTVELKNKPETLTVVAGDVVGEKENVRVQTSDWGDTTRVKVAGIRVEVIDDDSTQVTIGNRKLIVDDHGNVKWSKVKKRKFNGHWAGVEIGMNFYVTKDFNMKYSPMDEYMDLRMEKSAQINLNIYEQNIALSKNKEWGMLTGIGVSWNNYRFRNPTTLEPDSAYLIGYLDKDISVRKSKLAIAYLQVPLIFEWQNQTVRKINSFHVGVGVVLGVRMWSWQKKYYDELNKEYTLTQYDPNTSQYEDRWTRTSPNYNKTKSHDDYHLQPFKADATLRIGWGYVNLFATYNLITMFRADKGPELHQMAAGITLLGW